jgi:hypothetical protein
MNAAIQNRETVGDENSNIIWCSEVGDAHCWNGGGFNTTGRYRIASFKSSVKQYQQGISDTDTTMINMLDDIRFAAFTCVLVFKPSTCTLQVSSSCHGIKP